MSLELAKKYVEFVCAEAPVGSNLVVMWHDHELGSYPSLGVWYDGEPPWGYIYACERALNVFNEAVSWFTIKQYSYERAFSEGEDTENDERSES